MTQVERIPHCSHWGAYTLLVRGGRIVGVEPRPGDANPSRLIESVEEWANPRLRIERPMVRQGWLENRDAPGQRVARGNDRLVTVDWPTAADLVAGEIRRVTDTFGGASIFAGSYGWTSAGRFHHAATLLKKMLNLVGGFTDHVDTYSHAAGPVILRHTLGSAEACFGQGSTLDTVVENTETLVVFGSLSPRTAQNEAGGIAEHTLEDNLRALSRRGIKFVLVSPQRRDLPEWVDCDWWPIRPNTDTALMLALAGEIVAAGQQDDDFLGRCCSGADRLIAYLKGESDGTPKLADWAADITGIDADMIRRLARRLATTRSMLTVSWSLQRAHHGEQPFWAAIGLAAIMGQIGLPGGGMVFGYGSVAGAGAPIGTAKSPGMSAGRAAIDSFIPVARISDMLLNPGKPFTYGGATRNYPDVRLVYWAGGNPFHHHQDINRLEEAWTRPETIIVQDPVWTPSALRADIILPASTTIERNDIAGNRRTNRFFAMRKAIEPLGEARSDFEIFSMIASRLGIGGTFTEGRDEMGWIRHLYENSRADAAKLGFPMSDFESFWSTGEAQVPVRAGYTYLAHFREDPQANPLRTESGRIVLASRQLASLGYDDCGEHARWYEPQEWLGTTAADGRLHLLSNQPAGRLHSQIPLGRPSMELKSGGREIVRLNPAEAATRDIGDGDVVRLFNQRGDCLAVAELDAEIARGVAILPTGAWITRLGGSRLDIAGNPNVLTPDIPSSAFSQGCAANTCLVSVEPFGAGVPDAIAAYEAALPEKSSSAS